MSPDWFLRAITLILLLCGSLAVHLARAATCTDANLVFSTATLESLLNEPEKILADEAAFWDKEPAQHYTRLWAEAVDYQIDYEKWRASVKSLADLPEKERSRHSLYQLTERIVDGRQRFLESALPFICSYLPAGANLDVSVYFTAHIPARSFLREGIVINVSAPYWHGNSDNILNNLIHEIWHVGYAKNRDLRSEEVSTDTVRYDMLDTLQNEGTATYVGYQADDIFHAPDEKDYRLLENATEVSRLLAVVNHLFAQVDVLSADELNRLTWQRGVIERAYYIVGAYMAQTIEDALGRQALVDTVAAGPVSFVRSYNSLVDAGREIVFQPVETTADRGR
jgi:hypothetical protein